MCAGVLGDVATATGIALRRAGDFIVLVGEPRDTLTGSAWVREGLGRDAGAPPPLDLSGEARLQELAVASAEGRWARAAHDVSDGGLAVTLAEMLLAAPRESRLGLEIDFGTLETPAPPALFCERPGIVFEVSPERATRLFQAARERSLLAWPIGTVSAQPLFRAQVPGHGTLEWSVEELAEAASTPLGRLWNEALR
jgi:phosphoribosylformylglycinamidine synthase